MGSDHDRDGEGDHPPEPSMPPHSEGYPPADLTTLLLSLGTSALLNLGVDPAAPPGSPSGEKATINLPVARHAIDMLAVLEEKTRGNLTGEEERLLHQLLLDLRMRFVAASKAR